MGTRSITTIIDNAWGRNTKVCTMYRQYDGYPSGHGKELAEFLAPIVVVNGIGLDETRKIANGAGCLAAQMVQHFKESAGPGGIYLEAPRLKMDGEDYSYRIIVEENLSVRVEVHSYQGRIFQGGLLAFTEFCSKEG